MMGRGLHTGAPYVTIVLVVIAGFASLLIVAAVRDTPRRYAQIRATAAGCVLHADRSRDALSCRRVGPGVYEVTFSRSLEGSAVVATRETCCPGEISASVRSDRSVLVALGEGPYPVLAFVVVS